MKVICINNKTINGFNLANRGIELLVEGETYTVTSVVPTSNGYGKYYLKEVKAPNGDGFSSLRFAPLSSIDETEFVRNYQTETAPIAALNDCG